MAFPVRTLRKSKQVTIANAASLSGAAEIVDGEVVGLIVPTFTSAAVTFMVSDDNKTFYDLFDDAATPVEVSIAAGTHNRAYRKKGDRTSALHYLQGWKHIKVRSGVSATPVNQGAARTITLVYEVKKAQ